MVPTDIHLYIPDILQCVIIAHSVEVQVPDESAAFMEDGDGEAGEGGGVAGDVDALVHGVQERHSDGEVLACCHGWVWQVIEWFLIVYNASWSVISKGISDVVKSCIFKLIQSKVILVPK